MKHTCQLGLSSYCEKCEQIMEQKEVFAHDAAWDSMVARGNEMQFESKEDAISFFDSLVSRS